MNYLGKDTYNLEWWSRPLRANTSKYIFVELSHADGDPLRTAFNIPIQLTTPEDIQVISAATSPVRGPTYSHDGTQFSRLRDALYCVIFFFQAEDGIRDHCVTGVQTCALPI